MQRTTHPEVPADQLARLVAPIVPGNEVTITSVTIEPLGYGVMNPVTQGLDRVSGTATADGRARAWSMVRKTMGQDPPNGPVPSFEVSDDPRHWNYWKRELLAYTSDVLPTDAHGIRAPRCYGTEDHGDRAVVWLEELRGPDAGGWSIERCAEAAAALGRWQGGLVGEQLPDVAWFGRDVLRELVETRLRREAGIVLDPANWRAPLVREVFDSSLVGKVRAIWESAPRLLAIHDALPQTLTHHDFRAANLFDDSGATVLIDWQFLGAGSVGQDIVSLVVDSVFMSQFPSSVLRPLETAALEAYTEGLHETGWRGSFEAVQAGYAATAALRFGLASGWLVQLANRPEEAAIQQERSGVPVHQLLRERLEAATHSLDLGLSLLAG